MGPVAYINDDKKGGSSNSRVPDWWWKGHGFDSWQEQQENFLLQGQLSVLTHFGIHSAPQDPVILPAGCRLWINTCTICRWLWIQWCCKLVHGCEVYTEHVPRQQQFSHGTSHITTNITVHESLQWVFKNTPCKATVTHSVTYDKSTMGLLGSREQRCIVAIVKCLGLISRWGAQQMYNNVPDETDQMKDSLLLFWHAVRLDGIKV